jgi:hypothetical protein
MSSTNDIFRENTSKVFVGLRTCQDEESNASQQFVLIEGDANTFRFLGRLFTAMADFHEDCSRTVHPMGAGSAHFVEGSDLGLMLHRNDCVQGSKR